MRKRCGQRIAPATKRNAIGPHACSRSDLQAVDEGTARPKVTLVPPFGGRSCHKWSTLATRATRLTGIAVRR